MSNKRGNLVPNENCHKAASNLDAWLLDSILSDGDNINRVDEKGNSLAGVIIKRVHDCACTSCIRKGGECLQTLGNHGIDFEIIDSDGKTPLYLALKYNLSNIVVILIDNGAVLNNSWRFSGTPLLLFVSSSMPNLFETILNTAFSSLTNPSEGNNCLKLECDLSIFLPLLNVASQKNTPFSANSSKVVPLEDVIPLDTVADNFGNMEMSLLANLVTLHKIKGTEMHHDIYKHPLVHIFLDLKWERLNWIKWISILVQIGMLISYSGFIFSLMFDDCSNFFNLTNATNLPEIFDQHSRGIHNVHNFQLSTEKCEIQIKSKGFALYYTICGVLMMTMKMRICFCGFRSYINDMRNHTHMMGLASGIFSIIVAFSPTVLTKFPVLWICKAASVTLTCTWIHVFVQMGSISWWTIYYIMFVKILKNFAWSLLMYSFVLIGFGLSYCVLFPTGPISSSIPLSIIKMLTLMVGEMEYSSLFEHVGEQEDSMDFVIWGHVWYVAVLIAVTLVLSNLLVGIAVSDIQGCKKDAEMETFRNSIIYASEIERTYFQLADIWPRSMNDWFTNKISVYKEFEEKLVFTTNHSDLLYKRLSIGTKNKIQKHLSKSARVAKGGCKFGGKISDGISKHTKTRVEEGTPRNDLGNDLMIKIEHRLTEIEDILMSKFNH